MLIIVGPNSVVDSEENKCMGVGHSRSGTRVVQDDQKEESIPHRSHDEGTRKLPGERDHAGHGTWSEKSREAKTQLIDNMDNGQECLLTNY